MSTFELRGHDLSDGKILAVDDHPANLLALSAILDPLHQELVPAGSGRQALELASRQEFAVILLDVMMPEMDGFETLARLRSIPSAARTPVVLLTAYELDPRALEKAHVMGAVDYLLKPIAPELLRGKVEALIALYRSEKEVRRRGDALAAKDRGIAMLAHDLQNPLASIVMSARQVRGAHLDDRERGAMDRISRGAARMSQMVRDLTDYAHAGNGAMPISPAPMDLGALCREVADDLRASDPVRPIDLDTAGDLTGQWDRSRLHQALSNLLGNAVKHGAGAIAIRAGGAADNVDVAVHNDGPPIAPHLLPVIFRPFERGDGNRPGLGLGLYIVSEIARAHRGTVSVVSSTEDGTTFVLQLPRDPTLSCDASPSAPSRGPGQPRPLIERGGVTTFTDRK
jgi:two-component system, sensor histidine kinase and response regulator